MSDAVARLVDERRAELMGRLDELEAIAAAGEGASTRALELALLDDELLFLGRLLEASIEEIIGRRA